ncbi:MAG TPA: CotH kinase family protein [Planctomycetota bacterium]|nr:CotH kinase family protein [Planctomycetota bacterium]OQC21041.1 MAG: CotH protein [Planctomycetes bacterium ADurb.Bin069]HNR99431.1 CotH kinase family protein [Planctomycetota bacterium]HNU25971.1 CotH kinase family protein [Planctomycetota bacterium]HOE30336.1 CotH kinase family protein [Planctomycetota bacterium]
MLQRRHLRWFFLLILPLSAPLNVAAQVFISEFMASNLTSNRDEDGEYTDWIELYNAGGAAVDLNGWSLTDNPQYLRKWVFPAVTIGAGKFMLVFASGKDRRNPAYQLHTNFQLRADGEYLALTAADGVTIVHEYEDYPPQIEDVSYGFKQMSSAFNVIGPGAPARAYVPIDGFLGLTWTAVGFNDSSWISGEASMGFERASGFQGLFDIDLNAAMYNVNCSAYMRVPFFLANGASVSTVRLRMKYDDGFVAYLNGVRIMSKNAPAAIAHNSCATTIHQDSQAVIFEEWEMGVDAGVLRDGANVLAIHGMNYPVTSSDFLIVPELDAVVAGAMDTSAAYYLNEPTPGSINSSSGHLAVSPAPVFSHESGVYTGNFSLVLFSPAPGSVIRYTRSWSASSPPESWSVYSTPLSITQNTIVRACVYAPNAVPSRIVTQAYTRLDSTAAGFTSNLPLVVVNTFGVGIPQDPRVPGFMQVFTADGERTALNSVPQFQSVIGIKQRGSSSAGFPKKQFSIELWDEHGQDYNASILGLPRESDWILYGPYSDKALMRNVLAYGFSNEIGTYACRTRFVEAYLKTTAGPLTSADYVGVYVFMEKLKRDEDRIDVAKLLPSQNTSPEVTGGYILKVDRLDPGDAGFSTARGTQFCYVFPKEVAITPAQKAYIRGYLDTFEAALYSANFTDPATGYAAYVDVDSFIDHFLLTELAKNIDGYRLSTFFYKDREGKLASGPIWDFNLSFGNANYAEGWITSGWYLDQSGGAAHWWKRMRQDPEFLQKTIDRWTAISRKQLATSAMLARVDAWADLLLESQARNFVRWQILGVYVWPNWYVAPTWQAELNWMKDWMSGRAAWISGNYLEAPTLSHNGGIVPAGFKFTISTPAGASYYTLDGSDPRLRGGGIAPSAILYSGAITVNNNTLVRVRAKQSTRWSGIIEATYVVNPPPLTVTEIMYHPREPVPPSPYRDNDFEFIEIHNKSAAPYDLSGARFTDGIEFTFPEGMVLEAGAYGVIVKNIAAFTSRYGWSGDIILGQYTGFLSNRGERIQFVGPLNEPILDFVYNDYWYPETDGSGYSLVLVDPATAPNFFSDPETWRASTAIDGSPGQRDPDSVQPGGWQMPGDANQDARLDISDAVGLLRLLFAGGSLVPPCDGPSLNQGGTLVLLDMNGDGKVDLADPVYLLAYLFAHGPAHVLGTTRVKIEGCPDIVW